jgi:branched-chain amino acid aminotransferase
MIAFEAFKTTRATSSKLHGLELENIPFGKFFTDHMFEAEWANGRWSAGEIGPYQPILIEPSNAAWHYGQAIFEGIKAYPMPDGSISIFRPYDNLRRFNLSARRMYMPEISETLFIEGMKALVQLDKDWMPHHPNHALYLRPFMFASDHAIGVRPSEHYRFMIIMGPSGPYYTAPMRIYVEENYVRAVKGGVGYAKTAGNYAAAMLATAMAKEQGYDQVLWTDAFEHEYVQEIGTMNVFFVVGDRVLTPDLASGTILEGVTRDSIITLLTDAGYALEERPISIHELVAAYQNGTFHEAFGTGTAATVSRIKELKYRELSMHFDTQKGSVASWLLGRLNAIRYGHEADIYQWLVPVQ